MTEENRCKNIRYIDFINILRVDNPQNWNEMTVRSDGVWVQPLPDDPPPLFPGELKPLLKHPNNDPTTPALKFPCSYVEVQRLLDHVVDQLGLFPSSELGYSWTITGDELLIRLGVDVDIISQLVLDYGLPVFDQITREIVDIKTHKTFFGDSYFNKYLQEGPFDRFLFRPIDIKTFEKQHKNVIEELKKQSAHLMDSDQTGDETAKAVESTDSVNSLPQPLKPVNFFTRENGNFWHIGFEGQKATINHYNGLLYICYLLGNSEESISCQELYQAASRETPDKVMSPEKVLHSEEKEDQELHLLGSSKQEISDYHARQKCLEEYKQLRNDVQKIKDLPENEKTPENLLEAKQSETRMAELKPYLKERTFSDKNTKAFQVNVKKRLDKSYAAIEKEGMKKMAKHLRTHIITDGAFGYRYTGNLNWDITIK